jgi:hypothetical protein
MRNSVAARRGTLGAFALVASLAALPTVAALRDPVYTLDETLLLVYPEQILAGDIPNKDFFTSYGPAGLSLLALAYSVTGPAVLTERVVGVIYHIAIATGVTAMCLRHGRMAAGTAGAVAALTMLPLGLSAYAWLGAMSLTVWSLALAQDGAGWRRLVAGGALAGLAAGWRPETLVLALATMPWLWRNSRRASWAAGLGIGLLPLVAHAALGGRSLYSNVVERAGVNAGRALTVYDLDVLLTLVCVLVATTYLAVWAITDRGRCSVSHATLAVLLLPQALQRPDLSHVLFVACVSVPLAVGHLLDRFGLEAQLASRYGASVALKVPLAAGLAVLAALSIPASLALTRAEHPIVTHKDRSLPVINQSEQFVLEHLIAKLSRDVEPGTKLFVGSQDMSVPTINDVRLYHLLPEYEADAFNLEMPAPKAVGSALTADIEGADVLVLNEVPDSWGRRLFPYVSAGDDAANRAVERSFCRTQRVYAYSIYRRCD